MESKELILRAKNRESGAMEELINKYRPCIIANSTNFYISGHEIEDLIQIGTQSFINAVDKFDINRNNFGGYIKGAIIKNFNYLLRGKKKENYTISLQSTINDEGDELQDILLGEESFEERVIDKDIKNLIHDAIEQLPEELKNLVFYWLKNQGTMVDYANKTGIKYSTLMKKKEQALKILRKYIEDNGLM